MKTTLCYHHFLSVSDTFLSQAKSKGFHSKYDLGVKYAEKQQRRFAPEKLREGRNIIGLQVRTVIYYFTTMSAVQRCSADTVPPVGFMLHLY